MIKLFNLYFEYLIQRKHLLKCIVLLLHGVTLVKLYNRFHFQRKYPHKLLDLSC